MVDEGFPKELLNRTVEEKITYFREYTLTHPHLEEAYENLTHSINYSSAGSLIFLYGPSGVGKTTLIQKIYKDTFDSTYSELISDSNKLPAVFIRAIAAEGNNFDWKDYFRRLLIASNGYISEKLIKNPKWKKKYSDDNNLLSKPKTSIVLFRSAAENSLRWRSPSVVIVDEAQEIGTVGSGRKLIKQTNVLKSFAEETKITHVLSGTYDLFPLRNLNGQLSRRSIEVHFPRYDAQYSSHRTKFRNALRTFQLYLPLEETPDLVMHWEYLFERSIGCIGTLKDWLTRSLAWTLEKQLPSLTLTELQKRAPTVAQCNRALEEIIEGEMYLEEEKRQSEKLRIALGLDIEECDLEF